jgi:UDP-GlcNAc:undecaprenyl-phosphate GlcNAc-1-phosphate transferase
MRDIALTYCCGFLGALIVSFILTRTIRNLALARNWPTKHPSSRDIHTQGIPRLGGVAIFFSFVAVIGLTVLLSSFARHYIDPLRLLSFIVPASLIFLLGVFDDLRPIPPWVKFAVQTIAAVLVFFSGLRVGALPLLFGHYKFGWMASLVATVCWVLLVTNAFNLVDGLDGLAAGSALFSTLTVMTISLVNNQPMTAMLALILAGAILGFLRFNFNPATIFLGDCGSLFIGFLLSVLALVGAGKSSTAVAVAIPVVSFGLPILETALSVLRRLLNGQSVFKADRGHIHHKLLERGFTHRQVVVILYGVSAIFGLLSTLLLHPGVPSVGIVLFVLGFGIWLGVQHLNYPEIFEIGRVAHRTIEQKQIIINNLAFRRATDRLGRVSQIQELYKVLDETFGSNDFDGFELRLNGNLPHAEAQSYIWRKEWHAVDDAAKQPRWALVLDLVTSGNCNRGQLVAFKGYGKGALLVDINLLLQEFRVVLADALNRVLPRRAEDEPAIFVVPAERVRAVAGKKGLG